MDLGGIILSEIGGREIPYTSYICGIQRKQQNRDYQRRWGREWIERTICTVGDDNRTQGNGCV